MNRSGQSVKQRGTAAALVTVLLVPGCRDRGKTGPDEGVASRALDVRGGGACVAPAPGLVSWYRGEGNANDLNGHHPGTLQGDVTFATGVVGQAFSFDGRDDYVDLGTWFNLQTFTIAMWVKGGASQVEHADIIDHHHTDARSWGLQYDNDDSLYRWGAATGGAEVVEGIDFPADAWRYLAITRDTAGVARVFLDGVLLGSAAGAGPIHYDGSEVLRLGRWGGGGHHWKGQLDEIEIYSRALDAAEIQAIFNAGAAGTCNCGGVAITAEPASATKTVGEAVAFSVTATGTGLSYQWKKDGIDIPGATGPSYSLAAVRSSDAGDYTVTVSNGCGSAVVSAPATLVVGAGECVVPPPGLVSWYAGEGNADDVTRRHRGTLQRGVTFAAGVVGQAFSFDGLDDYVDLGSWFNLQTFTIAMWVKAGGSQAAHADIIDNHHTDFRSWVVQYDNVGSRYHWGAAIGGDDAVAGIDFPPGAWRYLAISRDTAGVARVYIDGVLLDTAVAAGRIFYDGSESLRLSRWGGGGRHWNGQLDEVLIFNRALAASDVQAIFNAGAAGACASASGGSRPGLRAP